MHILTEFSLNVNIMLLKIPFCYITTIIYVKYNKLPLLHPLFSKLNKIIAFLMYNETNIYSGDLFTIGKYCYNCDKELNANADVCLSCGQLTAATKSSNKKGSALVTVSVVFGL